MEQLNTVDTIKTADLSIPIAANYQANGDLFGHRKAVTAPSTIAIVADALRWQYEAFPDTPEVNATGYITPSTINTTIDVLVEVFVNDPVLGIISLGGANIINNQTVNQIAYLIFLGIQTNTYGYYIPEPTTDTISIIAPAGRGANLNGGNNLLVQMSQPSDGLSFNIIQFSGGVNAYTNTSVRGVDNYLIWLCGKFGLEAQYVIGSISGGGSVIPIYPTPIPNPIDFTVLMSGSFMVDGQSTVIIPSFVNYNIIFVRGGIVQPTVDLGSTYYNWSKATGTFTCYPAAVEGEIFQIIPATQIPTI